MTASTWAIRSAEVVQPATRAADASRVTDARIALASIRRRPGALAGTDEREVFVVVTEVRIGSDLGHAQPADAGLLAEIGPGFGMVVVPVDQVAVAHAHQVAAQARRLGRTERHAVVDRADRDVAKPRVAPG